MSRLITVVVPAYNEEKNVSLIHEKIKNVFLTLPEYRFEVIFVDDGSTDKTVAAVEEIMKNDACVKLIEFSRNFGKGAATSAGIKESSGDAVILIDADLQHPPELIPTFIKKWEAGADVVVGVRDKNKGEGLVKKMGSYMFYKIMSRIGETKITPRATDFRLLDRMVVDAFNKFTERDRMTRGLIDWLGFRREYVYFTANERINGVAAYDTMKLAKLAVSTFVSHSLFPLRIVGYLGVAITFLFSILGVYVFFGKYVFNDPFAQSFSGPAQLAILLAFLVGIILCSLGLIALYIANIKKEVANRPVYVVRKRKL